MKIIALSDLHCEFSYPDNIKGDKDACLVLAGDIYVGDKALREQYIPKWSKMFKYIIYVLGNHEYYRHNIDTLPSKIKNKINKLGLTNVFLLDDETIELDGIQFVGTTLWTDLNKSDPYTKVIAKFSMNDFKMIRAGNNYRKLNVKDWEAMHYSAMLFLRSVNWSKPTVVVTHHSPSILGIDKSRYSGSKELNFCYYTPLEEFILEKQPLMWVFGHTHKYVQTYLEKTLLYSNPRGYVTDTFNYETKGYDPNKVITLEN